MNERKKKKEKRKRFMADVILRFSFCWSCQLLDMWLPCFLFLFWFCKMPHFQTNKHTINFNALTLQRHAVQHVTPICWPSTTIFKSLFTFFEFFRWDLWMSLHLLKNTMGTKDNHLTCPGDGLNQQISKKFEFIYLDV